MHHQVRSILSVLLLTVLLAFTGCGGGGSDGGGTTPVDDPNDPAPDPIEIVVGLSADAGDDQNVLTSSSVTLDGSGSQGQDTTRLTYAWKFVSRPSGSNAVFSDPTIASPHFTADRDGRFEIQLTIHQDGESDTDTVIIVASTGNVAPVANAGADQNVQTNTLVTLDGSRSSDANGDNLAFRWSLISKAAGSSAQLSNSTSAKPTFTADRDGTYIIRLVIHDGTVDSIADQVSVTASTANSAPTANAGSDQNVEIGSRVTLDGSGSSDSNGDSLTYQWSVVSNPGGVTLSSTTSAKPTFSADREGTYVFSLTVNDGKTNSSADRVSITSKEANLAPIVDYLDLEYGYYPPYFTYEYIYLEAFASDANGDSLTYDWTITSKPSDSQDRILDSHGNTDLATFTPDVPGEYIIEVVANDGQTDSSNSLSLYFYIEGYYSNNAPVAYAGDDVVLDSPEDDLIVYGSGYDEDGDELTYIWTLLDGPNGLSQEIYPGAGGPPESVKIDTFDVGVYTLQLIVNDGTVDSAPDTMTITATQQWRSIPLR